MKKFMDRKQGKGKEYRVGDLVLLSMKNLKWQMKGRRSEKLIEHFVGPYKIKGIISSNAVMLYKSLGKLSNILHLNDVNNQLERRAWSSQRCSFRCLVVDLSI